MERLAKNLILTILVAILLLPLYDKDWGGTPLYTKAIIFQALVLVAVALWLPLARASRSYRPDWRHPLVITSTVWLAVNAVAAVAGVDVDRSFWSTIIRMTGVFGLVHLWLYFLMLTVFLRDREQRRLLVMTAVVISLAVGILAVREYAMTHTTRVMTVLDNAGFLGGYAAVGFWLCVHAAFTERRGWRYAAAVAAVLSAIAVVLSGSRGPLVALLASLGLVSLTAALMTLKRRAVRYGVVVTIAAMIAALALAWSWMVTSPGRAWVGANLPPTASRLLYANVGEDRLALWQVGWEAFQVRPMLGWGPENFQSSFDRLVRPLDNGWMLEAGWYDRPHNLLVERLANLGLLGGLATLATWLALALTTRRRWLDAHEPGARLTLLTVLGALLAYALHVCFLFEIPSVSVMMLLALALLTTDANERVQTVGEEIASKPSQPSRWWFAATLVACAPIVWYGSVVPARAVAAFDLQYQRFLSGDNAVAPFADVLDRNTPAQRDLVQKFVDKLRFGREVEPAAPPVWQGLVELAVRVADSAASRAPNDFRTIMVAASAHRLASEYDSNEEDAADRYLDRALVVAPERLKAFEERGELRLANREYAAAVTAFRLGLDHTAIKSQQGRLHCEMAIALLNLGDVAEATREMRAATVLGHALSSELRPLGPLAEALKPGEVDPVWLNYVDSLVEPWVGRRAALKSVAIINAKAGRKWQAEAFLEILMYKDPASADALDPAIRQYLKAAAAQ